MLCMYLAKIPQQLRDVNPSQLSSLQWRSHSKMSTSWFGYSINWQGIYNSTKINTPSIISCRKDWVSCKYLTEGTELTPYQWKSCILSLTLNLIPRLQENCFSYVLGMRLLQNCVKCYAFSEVTTLSENTMSASTCSQCLSTMNGSPGVSLLMPAALHDDILLSMNQLH